MAATWTGTTSPWRVVAEGLGARVDEDLLPALYAMASVSTSQIRAEFSEAGLAWVEAESGAVVPPEQLERSIHHVIRRSGGRAAMVGVASGVAGLASVPPEALAVLVMSLRLGQRLAVIHGFDPETDAGRLLLLRAMASAHDIPLPASARVSTRVSELPILARDALPGARVAGAWVARQVATRSATTAVSRVARMVPGLAATLAGFSAWRRNDRLARAMCSVYRRAMASEAFDLDDVVLADEIAGEPAKDSVVPP